MDSAYIFITALIKAAVAGANPVGNNSVSILITLLTTLVGSGVSTAIVSHHFSKKLKTIEKQNLWQTKLLDDIYNSHKSLWEELRKFTIPCETIHPDNNNENQIIVFRFMYFLRSFNEANEAVIEYRDKLYQTSLYLNKTIREDAEFIQQYLDIFFEFIRSAQSVIEPPYANTNIDWAYIVSEYTVMFRKDVLPSIIKLQDNTENFLRKGILEHKWVDITDSERQIKDNNIKRRLAGTKLITENQITYIGE